MELRAEFRFGPASCLVPILPDDYRHLQLARNQKRFVAELLRQAGGIDQPHAPGSASVTARQHVEFDSARLEQVAQEKHEWSLARPARGKIAHADDRSLQPSRPENSPVIKRVACSHRAAVDG